MGSARRPSGGGQGNPRFDLLFGLVRQVLPAGAAVRTPNDMARSTFVRLGGDSLSAMRLAAEARRKMAVSLRLPTLLSDQPLAQVLADALADSAADPAAVSIAATSGAQGQPPGSPASAVQQGMWIRERVVGSAPYNLAFVCHVHGDLAASQLAAAITAVTRRHDGLRTVFRQAGGQLERIVLADYEPALGRETIVASPAEFDEQARRAALRIGAAPFDLAAEPPVRWTLLASSLEARTHALILSAHHIVLDGWAIGLVLQDLFRAYESLASGTPAPAGPAARFDLYLGRQEELRAAGEMSRQAGFWQRYLRDVPLVVDLPADHARPAFADPRGSRHPIELSAEVSAAVTRQAGRLSITPAAFLLAAYALTINRYQGADCMLIGMPVAGRPTAEIAGLVATTINLVPVRLDIGEQSAGEYLRAAGESVALSLENSDLPFSQIVEMWGMSGTIDRHPIVQLAFGMHDQLIPQVLSPAGLSVRIEESHGGGAQFDLQLFINRSEPSYAGSLEYATAIWTQAEAEAFCTDFKQLAAELAGDARTPVRELRCLAPSRRSVIDRMNQTHMPYAQTSIEAAFLEQARRTPHAIAVREGDLELTYHELKAAAADQAGLLAAAGAGPGSTVLVGLERSVAEVVAVLGIVWAGAAYVGVDHDAPPSRVRGIVSALQPAAAIGQVAGAPNVPRVAAWRPQPPARAKAGGEPASSATPDSFAYVAFTSGSTGLPKGVCIPHRGVLRLVAGLRGYAPLSCADRVLRFAPLSFDASTLEIWGSLLTGATLEICPAGQPTAADLGEFISSRRITAAWLTAGLFRLLSEYVPESFAAVRHLLTGGDVVSPAHVRELLRRHPGLTIINGYGPTENTTFTTVHRVSQPDEVDDPLPIGRPVDNTQVFVLDQRGQLLPPGAIGELYVAGDGLATGYFAAQAQTDQAFGAFCRDVPARLYRTGDLVRIDSRGRLQFLGRRDAQVKVRGYRIELAEIERVLLSHPDVSEALVSVRADGHSDKQIVACCVPAVCDPDPGELAAFVADQLPGYMVPALWAVVRDLPVTPNGKVDRAALERAARPVIAARADRQVPQESVLRHGSQT